MSYCELYAVLRTGQVIPHQQFDNSWGGAAFVWMALCEGYELGGHRFVDSRGTYLNHPDAWYMLFGRHLTGSIDLQPWEHNVLEAMYDMAIVQKKDFEVFARSLDIFEDRYHDSGVCHLSAFARTIRELPGLEEGIAFRATSVSPSPWVVHDDEDESEREYDVRVDSGHWYANIVPLEGS